jgi:putative heme iron utilization protein
VVAHMNADHGNNLKDYVRFFLDKEAESIRMCGMDQFGIDLAVNEIKERICFENPLKNASEARSVLVEMAKAASPSF